VTPSGRINKPRRGRQNPAQGPDSDRAGLRPGQGQARASVRSGSVPGQTSVPVQARPDSVRSGPLSGPGLPCPVRLCPGPDSCPVRFCSGLVRAGGLSGAEIRRSQHEDRSRSAPCSDYETRNRGPIRGLEDALRKANGKAMGLASSGSNVDSSTWRPSLATG